MDRYAALGLIMCTGKLRTLRLWLFQQFLQHAGTIGKRRHRSVLIKFGLEAANGLECCLVVVLVSQEDLDFVQELQHTLHICFRQKYGPVIPGEKQSPAHNEGLGE